MNLWFAEFLSFIGQKWKVGSKKSNAFNKLDLPVTLPTGKHIILLLSKEEQIFKTCL